MEGATPPGASRHKDVPQRSGGQGRCAEGGKGAPERSGRPNNQRRRMEIETGNSRLSQLPTSNRGH